MLDRIHRLIGHRDPGPHLSMEEVCGRLAGIRELHSTVALCPDSTGPHWQGIKQGTITLFPDNHVPLAQYYSNTSYSEEALRTLVGTLADLHFDHVVFRGFPAYFDGLIRKLHGVSTSKLHVLYAGPPSEMAEASKQDNLSRIVALAREGILHRAGFNKKGMAETLAAIYGIRTGRYILKGPEGTPDIAPAASRPEPLVGVMGGNTFNKNLHTQVMAALAMPHTTVHVLDGEPFAYLLNGHRIAGHGGHLSHPDYIAVLAQMDVNLYLAFSESWGNVITESLALGVPCLATANNGIYDWDHALRDRLVVADYDDTQAIARQTGEVLEDRKALSERCMAYVPHLNAEADRMLAELLTD